MALKEEPKPQLEKIPINFQLDDGKLIDGASIRTFTFQGMTDAITEAASRAKPDTFEARWRRMRMCKQVIYHMNGTTVPIAWDDIIKLPIRDAQKILSRLNTVPEGEPGKILRDGDGINQALTYELGTPIQTGQGKEPVRELEFFAQTYGDIEDVLAAGNAYQQTLKLIKGIAKPLGVSWLLLPDAAASQITVTDGAFIMNDILPRFIESPAV